MSETAGSRGRADAPWVEKFRPKTLEDVAAHKEIIDTSKFFLYGRSYLSDSLT